jgi:RNA-directed DNA polymerase
MKESYDEGVASHIGPESCAEDCKGLSEALTGARAGRVWSRVILLKSREPTWWDEAEGHSGRIDKARGVRSLRGRRPQARAETPCTGIGRSHDCLCSQGNGGRIGKFEDASR